HVDLESAVGTYDVAGRLQAVIPIILSNIVGAASSIANVFVQGGLMIIISYYFALDGRRLAEQFISTLPEQYRDDASYLMESMRTAFFGFLKGNTIMAATYAFGTAGIMLVAGLPYVLLTSILAGICAVIPVIGAMLAVAIVLIIVAIAQSASGIFVLIATIILQQIVYNLVGPRAMKQTIGIHPLLMFVAILVGARLAGAWGAFFGIPIAAAGLSMIRFYRVEKANRPSISNLDGAGSTAGRAPLEAATNAPIETTRA
ncbi:MAG TPA: AI-2E family transporter, partial [Chloroflexota bacterium]|nr:AI-2E family transporter [Chloroflexota bacterium]